MNRKLAAITALALLAGCAGTTSAGGQPSAAQRPAASATRVWAPPPANGTFDYQLGGPYTPRAEVTVVDRDRTARPVEGLYNVCYVNGFQTQPGEASYWRTKHSKLLLHTSRGRLYKDPDWPDEYLLDTTTAARRAAIATIVNAWIDGCATSGFQAVEPDNLDTYTRATDPYTKRPLLTRAGNLALAKLLAQHAHSRGLAIGQKNTVELGSTGRTQVGFDFAIAEECQVYAECDDYTRVYGAHVIEVEYTDTAAHFYSDACRARGATISVILRDRDVVPAGRKAYRYKAC
ncbi:endo alpha-1,4 polygalactosaminidase [Spongisporangium articulatum]|uniref:Endo alpha-1,4 polygalactosaminidase n=1 Tax=Spongisporangium articulatum TaxID=3362603 RepID=A0ABW8AJL1_9ACTN